MKKDKLIEIIEVWEVSKPNKMGVRVGIKPILTYANGLPIYLDKDTALEKSYITKEVYDNKVKIIKG